MHSLIFFHSFYTNFYFYFVDSIHSFCDLETSPIQYLKIDGAVVESRGDEDRNLSCIVTFQARAFAERFMLRFDLLKLDYDDHLYIYDGVRTSGQYMYDLAYPDT